MANIAAIFHWSPRDMDHLSIGDLMQWQTEAIARLPKDKP